MTIKKLHRIYFGFDGKPDPYIGYLDTWKQQLSEYEICNWNAENLPLDICEFSRTMYELRDHAFLSDYFRWWVLREHGGIYLDADIEIVNGGLFNQIVERVEQSPELNAAIGIDNREGGWYTAHSVISKKAGAYAQFMCSVYEGLGPVSIWRRKIFYFMAPQLAALYFAKNGHNPDGMGTSPNLDKPISISGVEVLPQEYWSPMTPAMKDGKLGFAINALTENTSICHHFSCSWHDEDSPYRMSRNAEIGSNALLMDLVNAEKGLDSAKSGIGSLQQRNSFPFRLVRKSRRIARKSREALPVATRRLIKFIREA
jgi:hypothetical protein